MRHLNLFPLVSIQIIVLFAGSLAFGADKKKENEFEINTVLMESTIKIEGTGSSGTAFLVGRPFLDGATNSRFTLVTAAHILDDIQGEVAILHLRRKAEDGRWIRIPAKVKIRNGKVPLYVRHKDADVAAMYVALPDNMITRGILGTQLLADDEVLKKFAIHPVTTYLR